MSPTPLQTPDAQNKTQLFSRDRFLVLATDGLWERVTNEEAVTAVERFHHYHQPPSPSPQQQG
jgi:serine/threonine protein phosphatase PrpC